jgi:type II secretion system protein D
MMANIRNIVQELDTNQPSRQMAMRVYPLKNQRAEDLKELLEEFFTDAGLGDAQEARQMIINFVPIDPATGQPMINPDTGVALVKQLVHQDITVSADPNTNSLMVLAPADSIDMMAMLVEMLDSVTPVTATLQVFPLLNADATEMKSLLDDLFKPATGTEGQRQLVIGGGEGGATAAVSASTATGGGVSEVVFGVDERTNSLIAAGSPSYLKIVETLVLQLDYKEIEERIVRVVHLRNAKAEDVATTMEAYFEQESQAVEEAAEGEAAPRRLQRHVTITDSGETANSLLLSYSPRMESQIISMINELDQPPPQVMIQVLMAEVTLNDRFEMGMEFALQDLLFSEGATIQQTPNGPILHGDDFDFVFGTDVGAAGSGNGLNFTVTGEDFNFLFHALQTEGRLEVLSRPSILVRDNQEATFTVGERVPTVQDIVVSSAGVVTPSVTYEEVGVILGVTPIINPDGFVNLDIAPEISAIGTSSVTVSTGVTLPTFTQRKAETSVTVKDGETIIIGGLITSQENSSETKLPLAGDVPILGWAFRASTRSTTKTELLIVLTPHVIRDPTQARAVSVHMRDQTGLNDNIRQSPLMQGLQVLPEDDQFGPIEPIRPGGTTEPYTPAPLRSDEQGPELEEYGPPVSSLTPADRNAGHDLAIGPVVTRRPQAGVAAAAR